MVDIINPIEGESYYSDYPITFTADISDVEDEFSELKYYWKSDLDGEIAVDSLENNDGQIIGNAYLTQGIHLVSLTVEDTGGKMSTASTPSQSGSK